MRHCKYTWLLVATLLGIITSCEKEQFDKEAYNEYVDYEFMIDNMDRSHDWNLTKSDTITIIAPATIKAVQILTGTPYGGNEVEIAAEGVCYGDETTLAYTIPSIQTKLYLAALSPDGKYLGVTPFDFKTKSKISVISVISTGIISIIMAYMGFGVWSLIFPNFFSVIIQPIFRQ